MRTLVTAEDVAETVAFLCSDGARHISGQALAVDGHTETLGQLVGPRRLQARRRHR